MTGLLWIAAGGALVVGLALGLLLGAAWATSRARTDQERLRQDQENAFRALAAAALRGNTEQFLALAEQKLATGRAEAAADLNERKLAIEGLLAPLRDTLTRLDQKTSEIGPRADMLAQAVASLQKQTTSLTTALRGSSQARGQWGEIQLENIAEMAGLRKEIDYELQKGQSEGGRPDMIVKLPGGRRIAVDSKVPLTAYLEAAEAPTDELRRAALKRHASDLKKRVGELASKGYAAQIGEGLDMVVLFLPGDALLSAAFDSDPKIQTDAIAEGVLIATPVTLVALLRNAALFWQQQSLADNARSIAEVARILYQRVVVFSAHLQGIGGALGSALRTYNDAVGSFQARVKPMADRLEEFKVADQEKQLELLEPIDETPRRVES